MSGENDKLKTTGDVTSRTVGRFVKQQRTRLETLSRIEAMENVARLKDGLAQAGVDITDNPTANRAS